MEAYIEAYKDTYLTWRGGKFAKKGGEYCLGSKQDCARFMEDGAIQIPWGSQLDESVYRKVKGLRLIPGATKMKNAGIPAFVKDCINLEFLEMPLPFIGDVAPDSIPATLKSLMLRNSKECAELIKKIDLHWPTSVVLPNLRALQFIDIGGPAEVDSLLELNNECLPSLQFLECGIRKGQHRLETIADLKGLTFLALEHVRNHDIFGFIHSPLRALSLVDAAHDFPFAKISSQKEVEFLWLNNLRCDLDCKSLLSLPKLLEVNVINSSKIINLEALLGCKKLESIQFISCGRPFKEARVKELFKAKRYKRLEIDFS